MLRAYPDALFVLTRRRFRDTILSNINKYPRKGVGFPRQVVEKVFRWVSDRKAIRRFKRSAAGRFVEISYEDLLHDTQAEIAGCCASSTCRSARLTSAFPSNTAFGQGHGPRRRLSTGGWAAVHMAAGPFLDGPVPGLPGRCGCGGDRSQAARRFPKYTFVPAPSDWSEA